MPPDVIARDAAQICQRVNLEKLGGKTITISLVRVGCWARIF